VLAKSAISVTERLINVRRALLDARTVAVPLCVQRAIFHHLQESWEAFALVHLVTSMTAFMPNVKHALSLALPVQMQLTALPVLHLRPEQE
jgi:hypothetical protein